MDNCKMLEKLRLNLNSREVETISSSKGIQLV